MCLELSCVCMCAECIMLALQTSHFHRQLKGHRVGRMFGWHQQLGTNLAWHDENVSEGCVVLTLHLDRPECWFEIP
jgi:hypothetical protein